jgi:hypothetical protein
MKLGFSLPQAGAWATNFAAAAWPIARTLDFMAEVAPGRSPARPAGG